MPKARGPFAVRMRANPIPAVLLLIILPMAGAYHIDGTPTAVRDDTNTHFLSTSDWILGGGLCESEGPMDDRNANLFGAFPGVGGLCYTGRNDATGTHAPGADRTFAAGCEPWVSPGTAGVNSPSCLPSNDAYTRLDACSFTIHERNSMFGPFLPGMAQPCPGGADEHEWDAVLGTIRCTVHREQRLVYSERYVWWTYEGGAHPYSSGDLAGDQHQGSDATNSGQPGRRDAYHGHVEMVVNAVLARIRAASPSGSAVTSPVDAPFGPGIYEPCGPSPAPAAFGGFPPGPAFLEGPFFSPLPLCMEEWDGVAFRAYACDVRCDADPSWTILTTMTGAAANQDVLAELECSGFGGTVATDICAAPNGGAQTCAEPVVGPAGSVPRCSRIGGSLPTNAATTWSVRCLL